MVYLFLPGACWGGLVCQGLRSMPLVHSLGNCLVHERCTLGGRGSQQPLTESGVNLSRGPRRGTKGGHTERIDTQGGGVQVGSIEGGVVEGGGEERTLESGSTAKVPWDPRAETWYAGGGPGRDPRGFLGHVPAVGEASAAGGAGVLARVRQRAARLEGGMPLTHRGRAALQPCSQPLHPWGVCPGAAETQGRAEGPQGTLT